MLAIDQFQKTFTTATAIAWSSPPQSLPLLDNEVHIWRASLKVAPTCLENLHQALSPDEKAKAERFYFQKDRAQYIVARGLLRSILGDYLNMNPAQLRFSYSYYGKPALTTGLGHDTLNFNMSHSNEMAIYGVVRNRQIGVDIERIQTDFACEEIAERIFSPQENATLRSLPPWMKHEAFFNCWTRKEAFIKAKGLGLAYPLNQFEVSLIPGEPARLISVEEDLFEASRWSLLELEPDPGYAAALAVEGKGDWQLKCWQWTE